MRNKPSKKRGMHRKGRGCGHRRRGGRHGARGRLFAGGEMRIALLGLLSDGPAHGYELMQRLSDKTEGRYEPSAGATYPILQQLQDEGLADVEKEGGKKVYKLTDAGQELVGDSTEQLEAIWQRAANWRQWSRLDAPELGGMHELKGLVSAILGQLETTGSNPDVQDEIKVIVADAAEKVRAL